jgi:hypothetical protein
MSVQYVELFFVALQRKWAELQAPQGPQGQLHWCIHSERFSAAWETAWQSFAGVHGPAASVQAGVWLLAAVQRSNSSIICFCLLPHPAARTHLLQFTLLTPHSIESAVVDTLQLFLYSCDLCLSRLL